jgi:signal transduction histidine kinase/sugar lactone lactonase YvrE
MQGWVARLLALGWLWAAVACAPAYAGLPETPRLRQLTVADGLPSNRINDLTEDRHGYLWIASSDGLARFDGLDYRVWRAEQGLRDNFVWSVHVDARNRVWVATRMAGLAVLDEARQSFRYFNTGNSPAMGSNDVWTVTSTPDGDVWFGTADHGLHRLDAQGHVTRFMPRPGDPRSLPSPSVSKVLVAPDGALWVGTKAGVARWTGRDFERLAPSVLGKSWVNAMTVEDDGTLWIGTSHGVVARRPDGRVDPRPWPNDSVLHVLHRDRDGSHWLDIPQGLGRDSDGDVAVVPLYSLSSRGMVRPPWVKTYEDHEGGLWFASSSNGLWYLPPNWRQFSVLPRRLEDPASLGNASVLGIAPARDGHMWLVGTGGVLDRFDPESGRVEHVLRDVGRGLVLLAVHEDRAGRVWMAYVEGVVRFDPRTRQLRRWPRGVPRDAALAAEPVAIAQDGDDRVWIATEANGLQARDADGRVVHQLLPGDGQGLPRNVQIAALARAPDGRLWVLGAQGVLAWNPVARRLEHVPGMPAEDVRGVAVAGDGQVWVARADAIERYRSTPQRYERTWRMDVSGGLPQVIPNGVAVDAAGIVWMTSVRGIIRVDPAQRSARVFGEHDGLPSQEFGGAPVQRPGDGRVLAGSPEGLVLFDPAVVRPSTRAPRLVLEDIQVRSDTGMRRLQSAGGFQLAHDDRDLRVAARLLSFNNARTHAYRFRLGGHDGEWVDAGMRGERVFSALAPGNYLLEVQARNADNVWSPIQRIKFDVAAPWWRTPAAMAGAVGLAVLLLWWIADAYRQRVRRRHAWQMTQQERELAQQASLAKTRFLATLGHEVRTPMTGVLGMSELLLGTDLDHQQRGYADAIRRAGERLLRLVNDALDLARIESGKLELDPQPFAPRALVEETVALMAPLARQKGLAFDLELAPDLPDGLMGDANRIAQILTNLLSNAIKFTERGKVALHVSTLTPSGLLLEVADTGPGLSDEQAARLFRRFEQADGARTAARYGGSGLGLAICQELAAAMGGRISVSGALGEGARFIVHLPLDGVMLPVPAADLPPATVVSAVRPVIGTNGAAQGSPASGSSPGGLQLLLVEDDAMVAEVVTGLLQAQGHRVHHAPHALAAFAATATHAFDLALLDLDLPGMDGLSLARQLRVQGFLAPLVALTARSDAAAVEQAMDAGFNRFLRKPVSGAMLSAVLAELPAEPAPIP